MQSLFSEKAGAKSESKNGIAGSEGHAPNQKKEFTLSREVVNLRTALVRAKDENGVNSVLLTGLEKGVGTTSIAVALAIALAWDKVTRVLIIDANFDHPQLHQTFRIQADKRAGLIRDTSMSNLKCIPYGHLIRAGNRQFDSFMRVLKELEDEFDFLVVDSAPLDADPEVIMLSSYFKSVAVVVEAEKTRVPMLEQAVNELKQARATILGVILNRKKSYLPKAIANLI